MLRRLREAGVELFLVDGALRYSAPTGAFVEDLQLAAKSCRDGLVELLREEADAGGWQFKPDPGRATEPFPLTDLQQAYLVGEQEFYDHAAPAVFVHEYDFGADTAPDPDRLDSALRLLRRTHGALRLALHVDWTQQALPPQDVALLDRHDLRGWNSAAAGSRLAELSTNLTADLPHHEQGQPFLVRHVLLPSGQVRLMLALRLTAFDGVTTQLFPLCQDHVRQLEGQWFTAEGVIGDPGACVSRGA
ncbi:MAG: hypothetical protein L0I24_03405, partial [Pseudonocardia sp.]|nr:hypothetical protein [Pseudonocardia sp.]